MAYRLGERAARPRERAGRDENTAFIKNKQKFVKVHASSGYKGAVTEILGNAELALEAIGLHKIKP